MLAEWQKTWHVGKSTQTGAGGFGTRHTGIDKSGQIVAINICQYTEPDQVDDFEKAMASLEHLIHNPHPNIICLYEAVLDKNIMSSGIAMEMAATTLHQFQKQYACVLRPDVSQQFGKQLIAGVAHLHEHDIVHGNITSTTLYVSMGAKLTLLKIGDCGCLVAAKTDNYYHRAPEQFSRTPTHIITYKKPGDVWSMGCLLWEMLVGSVAFLGSTREAVCSMIVHRLGKPPNWPRGFPVLALLPPVPQGTKTLKETHPSAGREELKGGVALVHHCIVWGAAMRWTAVRCLNDRWCQCHADTFGLAPVQLVAGSAVGRSSASLPFADQLSSANSLGAAFGPGSAEHAQTPAISTQSIAPAGHASQQCGTPNCKCKGNCRGSHQRGLPCSREAAPTPPQHKGYATCLKCRCTLPGCGAPKFRSPFCFSHASEELAVELRAMRHWNGISEIPTLMPQDVKCFLDVRKVLGSDIALQIIVAWINDPIAIRALLVDKPDVICRTGKRLLGILQNVCRP